MVRRVHAVDLPLVIAAPGHYLVDEDIAWTTTDPDARAITIAADGVTLDLNGKTLRQVDPPAPRRDAAAAVQPYRGEVVSGNVGIWAEGRRDLRIRNGAVHGVQGVGIALKDCHQVDLDGLELRGCGGNGVVDTSFLYRNGGLFVMGTKDADGRIAYARDIRIRDCHCLANTSALDFVVTLGALVLYCEGVDVRNCRFHENANTSSEPSGVQFNVVGADFVVCNRLAVRDCEAHDNVSGGEPAGFFAWGEDIRFERCRADRNGTLHGHRACGFNISTSRRIELADCAADGNLNGNPEASGDAVKDFSAAGFRLGRDVVQGVLRRCVAHRNHSIGRNAPIAGFVLNAVEDLLFEDCVATGNHGAEGAAHGFLQTSGSGNRLVDCRDDGDGPAALH